MGWLRDRLRSALGGPRWRSRSGRRFGGGRRTSERLPRPRRTALVTLRRRRIVHRSAAGARDQMEWRAAGVAEPRLWRVDLLAERAPGRPYGRGRGKTHSHYLPMVRQAGMPLAAIKRIHKCIWSHSPTGTDDSFKQVEESTPNDGRARPTHGRDRYPDRPRQCCARRWRQTSWKPTHCPSGPRLLFPRAWCCARSLLHWWRNRNMETLRDRRHDFDAGWYRSRRSAPRQGFDPTASAGANRASAWQLTTSARAIRRWHTSRTCRYTD